MAVDSTSGCESVAAIGDLDGFILLAKNSSVLIYYWVVANRLPEIAMGFFSNEIGVRFHFPKKPIDEVVRS